MTFRSFIAYLNSNSNIENSKESKSISKRSINRKISALRTFFKYLQEKDIVKTNKVTYITMPKFEKELPNVLNKEVLVIEKRNHIGGNCFDYYDENGILIHKYGPHIFHTELEHVWKYLSKFTEWHNYEHKVLGVVNGKHIPIPFNLCNNFTKETALFCFNLFNFSNKEITAFV